MHTLEHRSLFSPDHPEALDALLAPLIAQIDPYDADSETALIIERIAYLTTCGPDRKGRAEILASFAAASYAGLVEDVLLGAPNSDELNWSKLARVFRVSPRTAQNIFDWFPK